MKQIVIVALIAVGVGFTIAAPGPWYHRQNDFDKFMEYSDEWSSEEFSEIYDLSHYLEEAPYNVFGLNNHIILNVLIQIKKINFEIREDEDYESLEDDSDLSEDSIYKVNGLDLINKILHLSLLDMLQLIEMSSHIDEVKMTVGEDISR